LEEKRKLAGIVTALFDPGRKTDGKISGSASPALSTLFPKALVELVE
jgi:hypothetical protein